MATGSNQAFCLRRNNHTSDMMDYFEKMFKEENLVDVTLSCEEGTIKAHKIILSACSPYFRSIFSKFTNPFQYPVIFMKDMPLSDLKAIIEFVYRGEVTVPQEQLSSVLKSAEALKVKGLSDVNCGKGLKSAEGSEGLGTARKRRKKRRKMCRTESNNSQQLADQNQSEEDDEEGSKRSSDDNSEYTDEDDEMQQHQSSGTDITPVLSGRTETGRFNETNSTVEGDIEPARLLEQSMITGDAQENGNTVPRFSSSVNMSNVQSITSVGSQGLMPGMAGSLTGSLSGNDANSIQASGSQNHLPTVSAPCSLSAFDSSGLSSMPGPSSMSQVVSRPSQPAQEQFVGSSHSSHPSHASAHLHSAHLLHPQMHPSIGCHSLTSMSVESLSGRRHYQCPVCLKAFSEKGNMKRHTQIHLQQRNRYMCDLCSKCFAWKDNFNRHRRIAHSDPHCVK